MITDAQAEQAAEYIRTAAEEHSAAKAARIYLQEFRKSKKALLINECSEGTGQARESYAYAHIEYVKLLDDYSEAVKQEEFCKWKLEAAKAKIEIYKSQQFNARQQDKAHQ